MKLFKVPYAPSETSGRKKWTEINPLNWIGPTWIQHTATSSQLAPHFITLNMRSIRVENKPPARLYQQLVVGHKFA